MLRVLLGLFLLAGAYWAWSGFSADAGVREGGVATRTELAGMLEQAPATDAPAAAAPSPTVGAPLSLAEDPEIERALKALLERIQAGDPAAREMAAQLLDRTDLVPSVRQRLLGALAQGQGPRAEANAVEASWGGDPAAVMDLAAALERLGTNNAFLHNAAGRALARRAMALLAEQSDDKALAAGTELLEKCMRGPIARTDAEAVRCVDEAYASYRTLADRVLCSPANLSGARSHVVERGDSLARIAARFRREGLLVDETSLAILNRIHNPNSIRPGQRIRCPIDPIRAVVEKRSFLMAVYVGDRILRLYWVGHGADDKTPVTEFTVLDKLKDPDWYSPDNRVYPAGSPENILGRYFVKFSNPNPEISGFGAHGTPHPETIGTMSSMGCIRMYDADIEELYRLLPRKAKVEIRDSH